MQFKIKTSQVNGLIAVPGSKSHTIRAVAIATMADGTSYIRSPLISADTMAAVDAARSLGAEVDMADGVWTVKGTGGKLKDSGKVIDMKNSGTSTRIFCGLAALADFDVSFDGDKSLRARPMSNLLDALKPLGVVSESVDGKCPFKLKGPLKGGHTVVDGKSSQFLTALLFAAPLAENDCEIDVVNLNEVPYVRITMGWMERQGIKFEYTKDLSHFSIPGGQRYKAFDSVIPADFSTATFPLMAAAVTGGKVDIANLDFDDLQGDKEVFDYFEKMGTKITKLTDITSVDGASELKGIEIDMNHTPDALPAVAVAAAMSSGRTVLKNVAHARIKETDRIECMTRELRKMGANVEELPDGMVIDGSGLHGAVVDGCDDHRIVMALTIAGMAADGETTVTTAEAAGVTYPEFVKDFTALGADITVID